MSNHEQHDKIDPDLFEPVLTSISTIATIGSFAIAWFQLRKSRTERTFIIDKFHIKTTVARIEGSFETMFRCMREITSLIQSIETRENKYLANTPIGFGTASYNFTSQEFDYYNNLLMQIISSHSTITSSTSAILKMLQNGHVSGEDAINDNLEDINTQLNELIFSRPNYDQLLLKMDQLRKRVSKFISQLYNLGN